MRYRIQKYKLVKEKTRQIVRFIMQTNEILQKNKANLETANTVSYTHLDVYKRQIDWLKSW